MVQGYKWGADRETLLRLYRQLIRSKLDYGSLNYASANENLLKRLDTVHNAGIRLATGAFKTSPITSLLAEASEPSLNHRRNLLLLRYGVRLAQHKENQVHTIFKNKTLRYAYRSKLNYPQPSYIRFNTLIHNYNLRTLPKPSTKRMSQYSPWIQNKPTIKKSNRIKNQTQTQYFIQDHLKVKATHPDFNFIYTDGSKQLTHGGAAFVDMNSHLYFVGHASKWSTISTLELEAIYQAISYAAEQNISKLFIITDSLVALQSLENLYTQNQTVIKIREIIIQNSLTVKFQWVPSHIGIKGNEYADYFSKSNEGEEIEVELTAKNLYKTINEAIMNSWQQEWTNITENKLRPIKQTVQPWKTSSRLNRHEETVLTRLRIGHTRLTHSYLFKPGYYRQQEKEKDKCGQCNQDLTVRHILCDCPLLQPMRDQNQLPTDITELLGDNEQTIKRLFYFLTESDLLNKI